MSSVCFYFQVHQPYRLRPFTYLDSSRGFDYFDESVNADIFRKVAEKSYLPANSVLLSLIRRFKGRFRVSFSFSGVVIEQMQKYAPDVLASFQELVATNAVEVLAETYHHSLASLYDEHEFQEQILRHNELIKFIFGIQTKVFRNTELIYSDKIGDLISSLNFKGIIAEGADDILAGRTPNKVYRNPHTALPILVKNYSLSDDIAFRFSNVNWKGYPLTPDKFAYSLHSITDSSKVVNLFMDYETFGEHQWSSSGIFDFLNGLPDAVLSDPRWDFLTPSEVINTYPAEEELSFFRLTSWADQGRDLTAWLGNRIQNSAVKEIMSLAPYIRKIDDPHITSVWRRLQTSDHFYYMSTSTSEDGDVHAYFSPFKSPYDGYIRFMNIVRDFRWWVIQKASELGDQEPNNWLLRTW